MECHDRSVGRWFSQAWRFTERARTEAAVTPVVPQLVSIAQIQGSERQGIFDYVI
jgi:hypothetical protein